MRKNKLSEILRRHDRLAGQRRRGAAGCYQLYRDRGAQRRV
nr:MAG TPA: hypothetical protein [Caudoviricetes sp.]